MLSKHNTIKHNTIKHTGTDTDWVNAETLLADGDFRNTGWRSYPGDDPLQLDFVLDDTHCISRASITWLVPGEVGQNAYIPPQ